MGAKGSVSILGASPGEPYEDMEKATMDGDSVRFRDRVGLRAGGRCADPGRETGEDNPMQRHTTSGGADTELHCITHRGPEYLA